MKLSYFAETDTLHIELRADHVAETRDLDENTLLDLDESGQVLSITMEHASTRADLSNVELSGLAA